MDTPDLLEALLEGAITSGLCRDLRGWSPRTGELMPAQYLLLVRDRPRVRAALRSAAKALLDVLDAADQAYAQAYADGCARFRALAAAPDWLLCPSHPDDTDPDVALLLERAVNHDGDWTALLEALHRAGSLDWQWAIQRCRTLMHFEEETGIDLMALVGVPAPEPLRDVRTSSPDAEAFSDQGAIRREVGVSTPRRT
jgi:hypothetical protein